MASDPFADIPSAGDPFGDIPQAPSLLGGVKALGSAWGNTAMFGYGPDAVGKAAEMAQNRGLLGDPVIDPASGQAIPRTSYAQAKTGTVKDLNASQKEYPHWSGAGALLGGVQRTLGLTALGAPPPTTMLGAASMGAGIGLGSNPGDDNTGDHLQLRQRGVNAVLGGLLGAGMTGSANQAPQYARSYDMYRKMANPAGLSAELQSQVNRALDNFNEKQIAGPGAFVKQMATPGSVEIDPSLQQKIFNKLPDMQKAAYEAAGHHDYANNLVGGEGNLINTNPEGVPAPVINKIPGDMALEMRKQLDALARYNKQNILAGAATGADPESEALAHVLRGRIDDINPQINPMQDKISAAIKLRDGMKSQAEKPLTLLGSSPGTDNSSFLASIDQGGGSNLSGLSRDVKGAQKMVTSSVPDISKGLGAVGDLSKDVTRGLLGFTGLAKGISKLPAGTGQAAQAPLFELIRRAQSNYSGGQ